MISVIIPAYNEETCIENTLHQLCQLKEEGDFEVIVSDGFSNDRTVNLASSYAKVIQAEKGRAKQLNAAAKLATGDILFFVHADMYVPCGALRTINQEIYENGCDGGGFLNVFDRHSRKIKKFGKIMHLGLRKREQSERKIFYGDNGIFVRKKIFDELGRL